VKLILGSVGRLKAGPERDLVARYVERARAAARGVGLTGMDMREADESRARRPEDRKAEEARDLLAMAPAGACLVALDERGKTLTSEAFAQHLGRARDEGRAAYAVLIGGPDGLDESLRARADLVLAFGAMTWPHQLVRALAAEQIYRAVTILSGHPYHRA
jgi:23S rRNA (pseudouridine1915-N3)-methyltransferase